MSLETSLHSQAQPPDQGGTRSDPPVADEALPLPAVRSFCTACGTAWQPQWVECQVCAKYRATGAQQPSEERSGVGPSLALYFTLLAMSAVGLLAGAAGVHEATLLIGLSAVDALIVLVWVIWARRVVVAALIRRFNPLWLVGSVGAGGITFVVATGAILLLRHMLGLREIRMTDGLLSARYGWGIIVLITCVQPAVFEELAFRGVILPSLQPMLAPCEAVLVSALLFMTLHLTLASFPHLFLIGTVLGYLRVRTGSLVPGMFMHFTHNLLCIVGERFWM